MKYLTLFLLSFSVFVKADDVEIYTGNTTGVGNPNVMFIFDTSGSMGSNDAVDQNGNTASRIKVSQEAAISILTGLENVNIGLSRFDNTRSSSSPVSNRSVYTDSSKTRTTNLDHGGFIQIPLRPIDNATHKNTLINAIEELPANAWTPLVETYDETLRYLSGEPVKYGKKYGSIACKSEDKLVKETLSQPTGNCLRYDVIEVCNGQRDYYGRCYVTGLSSTACSTRDDYISYFRPWWGGANRCYIRPAQVENKDVCLEPELETIETEFIKTVNNCSATSNDNYFYLSHHDTYDNSGNYITPINDTCQSNHVIIFTDGESSYDADSDVRIRNLVKDIDSDKSYITKNCSTDPNGTNNILDDSCMEELALYAQTQDIIDDSRINLDDNSSDEGKQNVTTYTIGGFVSQGDVIDTRLNNTATAGGGTYIRVEKGTGYDELREALVNTFAKIQTKSANFTAPSVAVNALNRLENSSELYFTLFSPSNSIGWEGNLKRYRLGSDGKIYGINDTEPAVNSTTGFFDETATSFWTEAEDAPDGKTVSKGGAARRLTASRNVITH